MYHLDVGLEANFTTFRESPIYRTVHVVSYKLDKEQGYNHAKDRLGIDGFLENHVGKHILVLG